MTITVFSCQQNYHPEWFARFIF